MAGKSSAVGETIPLVTENSPRLSAAVTELRKRAGKPVRPTPAAGEPDIFVEVERRHNSRNTTIGAADTKA